jgi:predicted GNAT family acetyltransferase
MPLGDGALAVAYYKVEDGRVVLLHTEVPQELSGLGYGATLKATVSANICFSRQGNVVPH